MRCCGNMLYQVQSGVCAVCCAESDRLYSITTYSYRLFINMTLARLKCKLPEYGHRTKHVGAILTFWLQNCFVSILAHPVCKM